MVILSDSQQPITLARLLINHHGCCEAIHGSGGTRSGSGSHGTGYIPGGGSPDYWNFIDAWELLNKNTVKR